MGAKLWGRNSLSASTLNGALRKPTLEVIRTRLREEGTKYKSFVQTARLVFREEGYLAFYRGLFAQLIRQIPNTAIVLSTYELIVYLLEDHVQ